MIKGQGAQNNPHNKFESQQTEISEEYLDYLVAEGEEDQMRAKTKIIEVSPKSFVNEVTSPDVGMEWSANPYQGCEHGCTYCYARNSHQYWGYSSGVDFERKILVKKNAPFLLEALLKRPSWKAAPIVFSGNTDCYQPIERKLAITRKCIEVLKRYHHPMGIITKNALVQRDLDLLTYMAERNLVSVAISITSLNDDLRRKMEPRTASAEKRLATVKALSERGIPVTVMMAPIIPGLNSHEIFDIAEASKAHGARNLNFTMVRLNGQIAEVFTQWITQTFPDKSEKVLNQIKAVHDGQLNDSQYGRRMRGKGKMAEHLQQTFQLAKTKFFGSPKKFEYDLTLYEAMKHPQMKLF